jgi:hypothetical protein
MAVSMAKNNRSTGLPSVGSLDPPGSGTPHIASHMPNILEATARYQSVGHSKSFDTATPRFVSWRNVKKTKAEAIKSARFGGME